MKLFFHKLTHWEYWPYQVVYLPVYFQYIYYILKTRSFFYFSASNPTIKNGGFFMESKMEIYDLIPKKYYPTTLFIKQNEVLDTVLDKILKTQISFPCIAKPDAGLRGTAVQKLEQISDLKKYIEKANFDYLIQNLIPYKNEIGLFYVRYPNQKNGTITGIVKKEFLSVTGDGKSTIKELILKNKRAAFQLKILETEMESEINTVLKTSEYKILVPYGNHCRGAKFIDDSNNITPKLIETIDSICKQIDGFYYGRLDLMFESYEQLEKGENFQIVEINGAISEPTHIYDPAHSLLFGWKTLLKHFKHMSQISIENHKKGSAYLTTNQGIIEWKKHHSHYNKILNF